MEKPQEAPERTIIEPTGEEPKDAEQDDLRHEEIAEYDRALDDYLNVCREIYWERVKDGTFPWPEDSTH